MLPRGLRHRVVIALGALVTGPAAFLLSGLIDLSIALRMALIHRLRSTIERRWSRGRGSSQGLRVH